MMSHEFRKPNHLAILGFLLPFVAAGVTALLILVSRGQPGSLVFSVPYLSIVPLILLAGLSSSIKSIPMIPERNDKDYAYAGLTLSLLFLLIYGVSLFYFFLNSPQ